MSRVFLFVEAYRDYLVLNEDWGAKPADYSYKDYVYGVYS